MSRMALLTASVFLSLAFAGCAGGNDPTLLENPNEEAPEVAAPASFEQGNGAIQGSVYDEEFVSVAGATVVISSESTGHEDETLTDKTGVFTFSDVPPGSYDLHVLRLGYEGMARKIAVSPDQILSIELQLSQIASTEPYHYTMDANGFVACGVRVIYPRPDLGPNTPPYYTGVAVCGVAGSQTGDEFLINWDVEGLIAPLNTTVFEMEWETTQATGRGLSFTFETRGCPNVNAQTWGETEGVSPLFYRRNADTLWMVRNNATAGTGCGSASGQIDDDFLKLYSRVFTSADTTQDDNVDASVTWQQPFRQYFTVFFYEPGPPDFRAVPDA